MSILSVPTLRDYLRRSKGDADHQQFSLDVQSEGARRFVELKFPELSWAARIDYIDDDRAGDDFLGRAQLQQLLREAQPGDIIVCRDQSRLGRDAIEVTLVLRTLIKERRCRLFYYSTGQEVQFTNAAEQASIFIQGTAHQMELEAIRSRTREALRSRVRDGRIAGGACFGYDNVREEDAFGRGITKTTPNAAQARIIVRIFEEYAQGDGLKRIAKRLNEDGVPSPTAKRRGSGSWAPSCIRAMLRRDRYRGIYTHGKVNRVRQGGVRVAQKADPKDIIRVEVPEWRIVSDILWEKVHQRFRTKTRTNQHKPAAKYALTSIARCENCGGSIGSARIKGPGGGTRIPAYACTRHHERGSSVCQVTVHQPIEEVNDALIDYLQERILTEPMLDEVLAEIRAEVRSRVVPKPIDVSPLESELYELEEKQGKLLLAIMTAGDIPVLATQLKKVAGQVEQLKATIARAKQTPDDTEALIEAVECAAIEKLHNIRKALTGGKTRLRAVFLSLFPDGLTFKPAPKTKGRRVWSISGKANLGAWSNSGGTAGNVDGGGGRHLVPNAACPGGVTQAILDSACIEWALSPGCQHLGQPIRSDDALRE